MKYIYVAALCIMCAAFVILAQQKSTVTPHKIAEFGDVDYESASNILAQFSSELRDDPGTKGYVISYRDRRSPPGLSARHAVRARNYLTKNQGISPDRVVAIDGGVAECTTTELWIVPYGTVPPEPKPAYAYERVNLNFLRKFDEYTYYLPSKYEEVEWGSFTEDEASRLDAFAAALKREPNARGYLVAYARYYEDRGMKDQLDSDSSVKERPVTVLQDPAGTARRILAAEAAYLIRKHGIDPSRLITIDGGHRVDRDVELWIAPPGAPAPNATPNVILPKKRTRR